MNILKIEDATLKATYLVWLGDVTPTDAGRLYYWAAMLNYFPANQKAMTAYFQLSNYALGYLFLQYTQFQEKQKNFSAIAKQFCNKVGFTKKEAVEFICQNPFIPTDAHIKLFALDPELVWSYYTCIDDKRFTDATRVDFILYFKKRIWVNRNAIEALHRCKLNMDEADKLCLQFAKNLPIENYSRFFEIVNAVHITSAIYEEAFNEKIRRIHNGFQAVASYAICIIVDLCNFVRSIYFPKDDSAARWFSKLAENIPLYADVVNEFLFFINCSINPSSQDYHDSLIIQVRLIEKCGSDLSARLSKDDMTRLQDQCFAAAQVVSVLSIDGYIRFLTLLNFIDESSKFYRQALFKEIERLVAMNKHGIIEFEDGCAVKDKVFELYKELFSLEKKRLAAEVRYIQAQAHRSYIVNSCTDGKSDECGDMVLPSAMQNFFADEIKMTESIDRLNLYWSHPNLLYDIPVKLVAPRQEHGVEYLLFLFACHYKELTVNEAISVAPSLDSACANELLMEPNKDSSRGSIQEMPEVDNVETLQASDSQVPEELMVDLSDAFDDRDSYFSSCVLM